MRPQFSVQLKREAGLRKSLADFEISKKIAILKCLSVHLETEIYGRFIFWLGFLMRILRFVALRCLRKFELIFFAFLDHPLA